MLTASSEINLNHDILSKISIQKLFIEFQFGNAVECRELKVVQPHLETEETKCWCLVCPASYTHIFTSEIEKLKSNFKKMNDRKTLHLLLMYQQLYLMNEHASHFPLYLHSWGLSNYYI